MPSPRALVGSASTADATGAAAALASGMLFGISLPPGPWGLLACAAWVPLLLRWDTVPPRRIAVEAFGAWCVAGLTAFAWIFAHPSLPTVLASGGGLLTWAFVFALPWPAAAAIRCRWGQIAGLLGLVTLHVAAEGLLSRGPWAFPWGFWGHALAEVPVARALAAVGGVGLLSAWVGAMNASLFALWTGRRSRRAAAVVLAVLAAGAVGVGASRTLPGPPSSRASVMLVQPGTPPQAWADVRDAGRPARLQAQSTAALDSLSDASEARPAVDLIVWPETALPVLPAPRRDSLLRSLQAWVDTTGIPLLTGGVASLSDASGDAVPATSSFANRAWLFTPSSVSPRTYDKHHLVPFAERVPFVDALPVLQRLRVPAGGVAGYQRGEGPVVWDVPAGPIAPMICFESVVAPYALQATRRGASALVTVAQTGWWGPGAGPQQHLAFSRLTAIATGRPVVLATVSGPSTVIRPDGTAAPRPDFGASATVVRALPPPRSLPLYVRTGDLVFVLSVAVGGCFLLALAGRRWREGRSAR